MRATPPAVLTAFFLLAGTLSAHAQQPKLPKLGITNIGFRNQLSAQEKRDGWQLLFDGKTLNGWTTNTREPSKTPVENGALNPHGSGGYMLIHEQQWGDFTLSLNYKLSKGCNSGVFLRTFPLSPFPGKDVGHNGLEIALDDTAPAAGYHDSGALYDLARPTSNPQKSGEWNHLEVTCKGPRLTVRLNSQLVNDVDLDRFTEPNRRPDGTPHKFDVAYKNHPRRGYLGLQDHGSPCWFSNIKLLDLTRHSP